MQVKWPPLFLRKFEKLLNGDNLKLFIHKIVTMIQTYAQKVYQGLFMVCNVSLSTADDKLASSG